MNDLISKLSEIRSEYNCFNQDEEPYYRALSEVISILSQHKDGDTISRKSAIDALKKAYWDKDLQAVKDDPCVIDAMTDWSIQQIKALPSTDSKQVWLDNPITSTEFITHSHSNGYELYFRTDDRKKYEAVQEECRRQIGHGKSSKERRGSWVGIDDEPCEVWECDRCGHIVETEYPPKFCEECSARMSEVEE